MLNQKLKTLINDIDHIIARVLSGEADVKEILFFNDWLNHSEKNKQKFLRLHAYWNKPVNIEEDMSGIALDIAFEKLNKRLTDSGKKRKSLRLRTRFISIAASIAILLAGMSVIYFQRDKQTEEYYTYVCPSGNYEMILPEGTIVHLNTNSKLTYSDQYNHQKRSVSLEGEAYFDVVKSEIPFELNLGEVSIEVLGTKFNITSYQDGGFVVATLEDGSIRFRNGNRQVMLVPGQQLIYDRNNSEIEVHEVDVDLYTAWKDGIYKYRRTALHRLCAELEDRFDVEIIVNSKWKNISVTGSFDKQQSLDEILDIMKKSVPFRWKRMGDKITIY